MLSFGGVKSYMQIFGLNKDPPPNIVQKVDYIYKGDCKVSNEGSVFVFIIILL